MSIISQESFDKLTKEEKEKIRKNYRNSLEEINNDDSEADIEYKIYVAAAEMYFGKENLQPKPQIKTWEDIENNREDEDAYCCAIENALSKSYFDDKLSNRLIATYKIAKLIELGYGGMVTEEEWENNQADFIGIYYHPKSKKYEFRVPLSYHFITFRNREVAEEFMSYPENRTLVEQYYRI